MNNNYLLFATKNGKVKKTALEEYQNIRQSGLAAIELEKDDQLLDVRQTSGKDKVLLITASGKCILFGEEEIRSTGRATQGVKGIELKEGDSVIGMDVISADEEDQAQNKYEVLVISQNGFGKKTLMNEYSPQGRGGQGVFTAKITPKTGKVVAMRVLRHNEVIEEEVALENDILVVSQKGQAIRLPLASVPVLGRHTQGVSIIRLNAGDKASALAIL
ncbi:hypothetical protein HGA91_04380 [candidate division WWE3 bacterium]|nr:hypothetical protein [candidate division WWE3 bacterium]